jgi:putative hydrolase of the HAD superfamily
MVKAVSFDLWFTLIWEKVPDDEEVYGSMRVRAIWDVLRSRGMEVDLKKVAEIYRKLGSSRAVLSSREVASLVLAGLGIRKSDELLKELASAYENSTHSFKPRANPEIFEVLPSLKEMGLKVAVVSNTSFSASGVRALLRNAGIDDYSVDVVVSSSDIGSLKPQKRIFDELIYALGIEAHEVVHVGDSCLEDVLGALSRGLNAIYYTGLLRLRNSEADGLCLTLVPSIENLRELPKLLAHSRLLP